MTTTLVLTETELAEVRAILADHLPYGVEAAGVGSRAGGTAKAGSDLDLVLEGAEPLSLAVLAALAEAFDESGLPWKVDLVDRRAVSEAFGNIIDEAKVPLG